MGSTWFTSMALPFRKQISVLGGNGQSSTKDVFLFNPIHSVVFIPWSFREGKKFFGDDATFDVFLEIPAVVFLLTLCQYRIYKAQ